VRHKREKVALFPTCRGKKKGGFRGGGGMGGIGQGLYRSFPGGGLHERATGEKLKGGRAGSGSFLLGHGQNRYKQPGEKKDTLVRGPWGGPR